MNKELRVNMDFYLTMEDGETKEQAEERFHKLMNQFSYQVYETEEKEV